MIYLEVKKLVLLTKSEEFGYAVNRSHGKMEYWNVGILGLAELDLFLYGQHIAKNEIRPTSALINIPFFHRSIIP
jgi:hypothetical protein